MQKKREFGILLEKAVIGLLFEVEGDILVKYRGRQKEVIIPDGIREIGRDAFSYNRYIRRVVIPEGVRVIAGSAFSGDENLEEMVLPEGLEEIGSFAFAHCKSLAEIRIPDSVQTIGRYAFSDCSGLRNVIIPNAEISMAGDSFQGCSALANVEGFVIVGGMLAGYYGSGGDVEIPWGVNRIGDACFSYCQNLTSVLFPETVRTIGNLAFYGCRNLTLVCLAEGLETLGHNPFLNCEKLSKIRIPQSVKPSRNVYFHGCHALADADGFVIVNHVLHDYVGAQEELFIPNDVRVIANGALQGKNNLQTVWIPDSVETLGGNVFWSCRGLRRLHIPQSVTNLEDVWENLLSDCPLEILCAPGRRIKSLKPYQAAAAVGWAELAREGQTASPEVEAENIKYLKSQRKRLYPTAVCHPELLRYMIDRRLIPREDLDRLLELAEDNGEIRAMILQYSGSFASQKATAPRGPRL